MVNGHPVSCASCGTEFPSYAAAERHRDETGHARFEVLAAGAGLHPGGTE